MVFITLVTFGPHGHGQGAGGKLEINELVGEIY
jgi:hypothetical protein